MAGSHIGAKQLSIPVTTDDPVQEWRPSTLGGMELDLFNIDTCPSENIGRGV